MNQAVVKGDSSMTKISTVLFDMDGVLIDAREWHYEALNRALDLFGMEISRYDHLVTYNGLPTRKKLEMLTMERGLPEGLHEFINEIKQAYTMDIVYAKCRPIFHHQYAISRLKTAGYRMAVCSNSVKQSVEAMLQRADLLSYFEFFLSNQDVSKSKPDPEIYLTAMKRLNVRPDECLVVEDNHNGIKAARASGAHLLCVADVSELNFSNISARIRELEASNA
jgi:beta-phosphoglucomutase